MKILLSAYPNDGKKLRGLIMALFKKKLIACANVVNYTKSYYIWENKLVKDQEKLLIIKFPKEKETEVVTLFKKLHPYQVPEVIILSPEQVDEKYLKWIHEVTQ